MAISKVQKTLLITLFLCAVVVWLAVHFLPDDHLHIVFCDVGQGDAILLSYRLTQILIDAGLDARVVDCLSKNIPFFDKQLEMVLITHPQQDHVGGLASVTESYNVLQFVTVNATHTIEASKLLHSLNPRYIRSHDRIYFGPISIMTIWPTKKYLEEFVPGNDLNTIALVNLLSFGDFDLLLTGDADHQVQLAQASTGLLTDIDVLKVPHHGGKQAILPEWISLIKPEIAVISAGKNNSYGHPRQETLDILSASKIQTLRTDQLGTIEIVSDGKSYWIK